MKILRAVVLGIILVTGIVACLLDELGWVPITIHDLPFARSGCAHNRCP